MASRARVVHLTTVHHPLDPRIYLKEARSLARAGFDVTLMARSAGLDDLEGVKFDPLPDGVNRLSRLQRHRASWTRLKELRPDVVHIHDPELLPLAKLLKSSIGARVIYDKHEHYGTRSGLEGRILKSVESWGLGWVDHVIVAWEPEWLDDAGLDRGTYRTIADGSSPSATAILNYAVEANSDARAGHSDSSVVDEPVLVYTGTISRSRGLFHMLDLVRLSSHRGFTVRLRIVGICNVPEQRREAESYIRTHGLGNAVELIGWDRFVPNEQIQQTLAGASVGLMLADHVPGYLVSIPTKFYEYLQVGLPMLVSDVPLWSNFVAQTKSGMAVDPTDSEAVFEKLVELVEWGSDDSVRLAIRAAGKDYQWDRMETRLLSVYEQLGFFRR